VFHKESKLLIDKPSDYQLFKQYPTPWSKYNFIHCLYFRHLKHINWRAMLPPSSGLKMEMLSPSETSVSYHNTTRR